MCSSIDPEEELLLTKKTATEAAETHTAEPSSSSYLQDVEGSTFPPEPWLLAVAKGETGSS